MDTSSTTRLLITLLLLPVLVFGQQSNVTVDKDGKVKGPKVTDFTTGSTDLRVDGVNVIGGAGGGPGGSVPGGAPGDYQLNNAGVLDGNANLRLESGQVKAVSDNFILKGSSGNEVSFDVSAVPPGVAERIKVPGDTLTPVVVSPDSLGGDQFMIGIDVNGHLLFDAVNFSQVNGTLSFVQTSMTNNKILGRAASGNGQIQEINIGTNLALDPSTQTLNATGGTSGITTIPIAASIYVDAVNGSSGGLRGRLDRPFQTLSQAFAVATAGDVIYVGPGTFVENTGITQPDNISLIGAGGSATVITSNLSDASHAVFRWGLNTLTSDLTVQSTGANSPPIGIAFADTAKTGALFVGVNTIGLTDGFKIDKVGTSGFTAVDCTTTSSGGGGTVDSVNFVSGTSTVILSNCRFNSTGTGAGVSSPRGIVVAGGATVKIFDTQVNISNAGVSGDNIGVKVTSGLAEIHDMVVTRDTSGLTNKFDLQQTGGTLNKENVSRPDGAALVTTGVIGELSRYASRDKNLSDLASIPASATNLLGGPGKGNIKVGDGSTWNTLVVGTDTQVLTADSTQTTGLKWGTGGTSGGTPATKQDVGDANATISGGVTVINLTAPLTASRVITLPAASTYSTLLPLVIQDPRAVLSGAFTLSLARAGSDTINGGTSNVTVLAAAETGGAVQIMSDGVNKWTTVSKGGGSRFAKGDGNAAHYLDGTGAYSVPVGSAGSGTVTDFSAGDLTPLFTTTEATTTTTPALSFSLSNAAANTVFGRAAGASGAPGFSTAPQFLKIGNLTSDGFIRTSAGDGTLVIDSTAYLTPSAAALAYQPLDLNLTTLAGLTATTNNFIIGVASAWASRTPAQARTTLGLVIGTNVQAWDADLDTWATKTAPSGTVVGDTDTQTLTNKRINLRAGVTTYGCGETSSATSTPLGDSCDQWNITALAAADAFAAPSGTPVAGQRLIIRIKDDGTARALTWNAIYRFSSDLPAPSTTVISKTMYVGFIYNNADSKWDNVAQINNL